MLETLMISSIRIPCQKMDSHLEQKQKKQPYFDVFPPSPCVLNTISQSLKLNQLPFSPNTPVSKYNSFHLLLISCCKLRDTYHSTFLNCLRKINTNLHYMNAGKHLIGRGSIATMAAVILPR